MTRSGADGHHPDGADARSADAPPGAAPAPEFDIARRGYRTDQVDRTVRTLRWQLEEVERGRREAEERVAELEAGGTPETFGMRAGKIIRMAEHDAGRRREHAESEAGLIIAAAHEEAEQIRDDAVAAAVRMHAEAAAARREADLCADAAASMNEHVLGLRSAVRGEVARLHAAMGAELRSLDLPVATPAPAPSPTPAASPAPATDSPDTEQVVVLPAQRTQPDQEHVAGVRDVATRS